MGTTQQARPGQGAVEGEARGAEHFGDFPVSNRFQRAPMLAGYTYAPEEAIKARDGGRLLAIRLETNRSCNLRCRYCYAGSGDEVDGAMCLGKLLDVVEQAASMGARSVVVIGGGEPTIYPWFRELIDHVHGLGVVPVIFTNLTTMTRDLAEFLFARNATVMGKMDSMREEIQDFLVGIPGAHRRIQRGLFTLFAAGFNRPRDRGSLRLGISCVTNKLNLDELE
ncbi:MAG: radical SAM protein, partial [Candidatus Geothermincolia bacterium]